MDGIVDVLYYTTGSDSHMEGSGVLILYNVSS